MHRVYSHYALLPSQRCTWAIVPIAALGAAPTVAGETFYDRCVRILSDIDVSPEVTRSVAGKTARKIRIGTIYPATIGVLPAFLSKIARKYPDIQLQIQSGSTGDIIRNLETGQINLGFIRPVENIGSLRFFSMASDDYLLAIAKDSRLAALDEIGIDDLRDQKIVLAPEPLLYRTLLCRDVCRT
jgi:DNA-binding transcriptional LysR family regulator